MSNSSDSVDVRRMYLDDDEWERTHSSYKALKPRRDINSFSDMDETPEDYYNRVSETFNIPFPVILQWLYPHYYERNSVNNYAWLDFNKVVFDKERWSLKQILTINIISEYRHYVQMRSRTTGFNDFMCTDKDLDYWKTNGTWRVPPIVLDVNSVSKIPAYSNISGAYQLVEGHSRLGYLLALANFYEKTRCRLADNHEIFLMSPRPLYADLLGR